MNKEKQKIKLFIHNIGHSGEGVGYHEGYTIFVEGALPDETVIVELFEEHKNYGRARLVSVEQASPHRVQPPCPIFDRCGGCQLMHLSYDQQLVIKRKKVIDALTRIGKFSSVDVEPCHPSPTPFAYRNKIQLPVRAGDSAPIIGLYERSSHHLVEVESCHIHCPIGESVYKEVARLIKESLLTAYNPITAEGELRHLLIKSAVKSNEVLVILVVNGGESEEWHALAKKIMSKCPVVKGVVLNINREKSNVILGRSFILLEGSGAIHEQLGGLIFKISPASFFQVNAAQAECLYERALEWADLKGTEAVLDAYCGVGTLALIFAQRAKKVVGIECVAEAIRDAKENAAINNITNVQFFCELAENKISSLSKMDLVILNPPRKGCELSLIKKIGMTLPAQILYISCDPATLARDLGLLAQYGYGIEKVQPFDMFPQTAHVETLVQLKLRQ